MLKVQLDSAIDEKQKHLEANSNEKVAYETTISKMNVENKSLQSQIEQMLQRFEEMEDKI